LAGDDARSARLAAEFETQALRCTGAALRELVRPWLAGATLNKHARVLTLRIRRVPDVLGMESSTMLARDGQVHNSRLVVTRRIKVPHSPLSRLESQTAGR
jgi:hypothetical protein